MEKKIFICIFIFLSVFAYAKEKLNFDKLKSSHFVSLFDDNTKEQYYILTNKGPLGAGIGTVTENYLRLGYGTPELKLILEYNIKDNILYTYVNKEKSMGFESFPDKLKHDKLTWTLEKDETNLFSNEKLVSNTNFTLWNRKSKVPEGSIRNADNIKIYIVNQKWVNLLYNTKVRKGPGTNYEYNNYKLLLPKKGKTEISYLPKGRGIMPIGRTLQKEKIDDMEDYWYYSYILINYYNGQEQGEEYGWFYGALLDKD